MAQNIRSKGYEVFLPICRSHQRWSDRMKLVESPLFSGYVFCKMDAASRLALLMVPGVQHIVSLGSTPIPLDEPEIEAVQRATRSQCAVEPWPFVASGQVVRLEHGPLAGIEGVLVESRRKPRMVLTVTALKQSVALEIEPRWLGQNLAAMAAPLQ